MSETLETPAQTTTATASPKRTQGGVPTTDLVLSAARGTNSDVFPGILDLYVDRGATVADVTFGRGNFWKKVHRPDINLLPTDLMDGIDFRDLPYAAESIDALILDPPYMHSPGQGAHRDDGTRYERNYRNNSTPNSSPTGAAYHEAIVELYLDGAREAMRVLRSGGIFIVKAQDEVCAGRQRLTHVELTNACEALGFQTEDLFVVMTTGKPGVSRMKNQLHARKAHSYFLVFWKAPVAGRRWPGRKR